MLQCARSGDRAVFGDVTDQQGRQVAVLGDAHQRARDGADLSDRSGDAVDLGGGNGLHRVDHQQLGVDSLDMAEDGGEIDLGCEVEVVLQRASALGTHPHLGCRLLTRHVQHTGAAARCLGRDLEQEGGLADAGLAGKEQHRARARSRRRGLDRVRLRRWRATAR